MNSFWNKLDSEASFNVYKDRVHYDYIITGQVPVKFIYGKNKEAQYEDFEAMADKEEYYFEKQAAHLLNDEDFLQYSFEELSIGDVYCILENDIIENLDIKVGVTLKNAKKEVTEQNLKDDFIDLLQSIIDNLDPITIKDPDIDDDDYDDENEDQQKTIKVIADMDKASVNLLKNTVNESLLTDLDKKLVDENNILLNKNNTLYKLNLNENAKIDVYKNNELEESINFSKNGLCTLVRNLINEGYELKDKEGNTVDIDQSQKDLEQGIEKVDQLQQLKDELEDKVDALVNESKSIESFPSSDFTNTQLSPNEILLINEDQLTEDQLNWIINEFESFLNFKSAMNQLCDMVDCDKDDKIISIDEYINKLNSKGGI